MKNGLIGMVLAVQVLVMQSQAAFAASPVNFKDLREKVIACVLQPVKNMPNGRRQSLPMISRCTDLTVQGDRAVLRFNNENYLMVLRDSEDSDGGDLNDLTVLNSKNQVVFELKQVLGFRDVLFALTGHDARIPLVLVNP